MSDRPLRETIENAMQAIRDAPYRRVEQPPIHPQDYADARAWRGGDEPLTVTDYWRWRVALSAPVPTPEENRVPERLMGGSPKQIEVACEVMHDAYEAAAVEAGWETNPRSRVPWEDVPEANKTTMRKAVEALISHLGALESTPMPERPKPIIPDIDLGPHDPESRERLRQWLWDHQAKTLMAQIVKHEDEHPKGALCLHPLLEAIEECSRTQHGVEPEPVEIKNCKTCRDPLLPNTPHECRPICGATPSTGTTARRKGAFIFGDAFSCALTEGNHNEHVALDADGKILCRWTT